MKMYLHEPVLVWVREYLAYKGYKCLFQDTDVHWGIHYALKYADTSSAMHAYASPYVNLHWMLCPAEYGGDQTLVQYN